MSQNELRNLQDTLACKDGEICSLNEKLEEYEKQMDEKNKLQKDYDNLERWIRENEICWKNTRDEQENTIKCLNNKLNKSERTAITVKADNQRLSDVNECLAEQSKTLRRNEQRMNANIDKLKVCEGNLENELSFIKDELDEKSCEAKNLTRQIECKQDAVACGLKTLAECRATADQLKDRCEGLETDAACVRSQVDDCRARETELRDRGRGLETELERARAELEAVESGAAAAQTLHKAEAAAATEELERRALAVQRAETERDQVERRAADERRRADGLEAQAAELRAAAERRREEAEARDRQLKREACERDEQSRRLDEQLAAARLACEETAAEVAALEARHGRAEDQLDAAKRSDAETQASQDEARGRLEADNATLSAEVRRKAADLAELERQVARLRDEILSLSRGCGGGCAVTAADDDGSRRFNCDTDRRDEWAARRRR